MVNQSKMKQKCKICGYKTDRTTVLKNHVRIVHPGKYYCAKKICKKIVDGSMENHEETEHQDPEKRFKCDMCIKKFDRLNTLLNHKTKKHDYQLEEYVLCETCGKRFPHQRNLAKHRRTHTGEKIECKDCGNFFRPGRHLDCSKKPKTIVSDYEIAEETCVFKNCKARGKERDIQNHYKSKHNCGSNESMAERKLKAKKQVELSVVKETSICFLCGIQKNSRKAIMQHLSQHKGKNLKSNFFASYCTSCNKLYSKKSIGNHKCKPTYIDSKGKNVRSVANAVALEALERSAKSTDVFVEEILGKVGMHFLLLPDYFIFLMEGKKAIIGSIANGLQVLKGKRKQMVLLPSLKHAILFTGMSLCTPNRLGNGHNMSRMYLKDGISLDPSNEDCNICPKLQRKLDIEKIKKQKLFPLVSDNLPAGKLIELQINPKTEKYLIFSKKGCDICGASVKSRELLDFEKHLHRGQVETFACDICERQFATRKQAAGHIRSIHETSENVECRPCKMTFRRQQYLNIHNKKSHGSVKTSKDYKCDMCNKGSDSPLGLKKHKYRMHSEKKKIVYIAPEYRCGNCPVEFRKAEDLEIHKTIYHADS